MKFKASCFKYGKAMGCENFRRLWPVPAVGFLVYFLSGVFPILLHYKNLKPVASYIEMSLGNEQPFFIVINLFLPVVAAVLVFRYLHTASSAAVVHAMPFDRPTLFFSNFLSGFALCTAPILANGLILLCIAKPVKLTVYEYDELTDSNFETVVDIFSRAAIGSWILESVLIVLFIFTVAVFAGMVTGNSLMHFFTGLGLNFLAPVLYITILNYFNTYLFGFYIGDEYSDTLMSLSPFLHTMQRDQNFTPLISAVYLGICILVIAVSLLLYRRRALEKCGNTLVFRFMETLVSFLITFFALSLFGNYFASVGGSPLYRYAGYGAGAIIGFLLSWMLVKKTVHIFNFRSLAQFAAYACVFTAFFCALAFDVSGYETRIPDEETVASVELAPDFLNTDQGSYAVEAPNLDTGLYAGDGVYTFDDGIYTSEGVFSTESRNLFYQPENIQILLNFHQKLLADRAAYEFPDEHTNLSLTDITFLYHLKNGGTMTRRYHVPYSLLRGYDFLAELYESDEFRKTPYVAAIPADHMNSVIFIHSNNNFFPDTTEGILKFTETAQMEGLISALTTDMMNRSFDDMIRAQIPIGSLEVNYMAPDVTDGPAASAVPGRAETTEQLTDSSAAPNLNTSDPKSYSISFAVYPDYSHTLAWLEENGYAPYTRPVGEFAKFMVVAKDSVEKSDDWAEVRDAAVNAGTLPPSDENHLILTDPSQMQDIFTLCEERALDYNNYYSVMMAFPYSDPYQDVDKNGYQYLCYYLNPSEAPGIVRDYFGQ